MSFFISDFSEVFCYFWRATSRTSFLRRASYAFLLELRWNIPVWERQSWLIGEEFPGSDCEAIGKEESGELTKECQSPRYACTCYITILLVGYWLVQLCHITVLLAGYRRGSCKCDHSSHQIATHPLDDFVQDDGLRSCSFAGTIDVLGERWGLIRTCIHLISRLSPQICMISGRRHFSRNRLFILWIRIGLRG